MRDFSAALEMTVHGIEISPPYKQKVYTIVIVYTLYLYYIISIPPPENDCQVNSNSMTEGFTGLLRRFAPRNDEEEACGTQEPRVPYARHGT